MRRNRLQREQLELVRSLETKLTTCVDDMDAAVRPLRSELVEFRTKLSVCQTARRTCSAADRPPPCNVVTVTANLSVITDEHIRAMETMNVGRRALMSIMDKEAKEADALRADLRLCRMRHAETKRHAESAAPSTSGEALITSLKEWASNLTSTAVQSMTNARVGASSETGRVSAAPQQLVRLVGRLAEKTMVTAVTRVWDRANTMMQEHRVAFDFASDVACHRDHFAQFVQMGVKHVQQAIDNLPLVLFSRKIIIFLAGRCSPTRTTSTRSSTSSWRTTPTISLLTQ